MWMLSTALLLLGAAELNATAVTFSNIHPRRNSSGEIIDAHDGSYRQWGGTGNPWYYYAMGYGTCKQDGTLCNHTNHCGYGYSWIGVWKSPDLATAGTWELISAEARQPRWPTAVYFRVHVVFQQRTALYIMWVNVDGAPQCPTQQCGPGQMCACYFVGTATSADGPFEYRGASAARYVGPGDFDILVDGDEAYIMYTVPRRL